MVKIPIEIELAGLGGEYVFTYPAMDFRRISPTVTTVRVTQEE